jgi:hypothetical protein
MASPVICIRDTAISNGQLIVKDMWPNRSQANPVVDPAPQGPRYLRVVETPTLPVLDGTVVARTVSGLAAYCLVTFDQGALGANITPAESVLIAEALISEMRTGGDLEVLDINGIIALLPGLAGTGIGLGASTATVNNILQILGGATFTVPAGYDLEDINNAPQWLSVADQASSFSAFFNPIVEEDSSFWISLAQGDLLGLKSSRVVNNVTLDPYVVVYDGAGVAQ